MKFREISLKETILDIKSSAQYCPDEKYVYWTAITTPWRGKRVTRILEDYFSKEAKILDIGSSQGLTIGYLAQVFPNIQGIDIDAEAILTAKKRLHKLNLKTHLTVYDGKKLPFPNRYFDGIVATEVFEHVENRENFIREIHRVLKSDGTLIITAPNKLYPIECEFHLPFLSYLPKRLADIYVKLTKKGLSYDGVNHPTYKEFTKVVKKYFDIKDITFDIIQNYKKYYLDKERGNFIQIIALVVKIIEKINKQSQIKTFSYLKIILLNLSAGWVFVCKKNSKNSI